jgi:hypothetical protein
VNSAPQKPSPDRLARPSPDRWPSRTPDRRAAPRQRIGIPESVRAITRRWISLVPSKIV